MTAREMFLRASFIRWMGVELVTLAEGVCETKLALGADMLQQDGFAHAGIVTTLADHSCGGAVGSLLKPGEHVLTAEFKSTFVRAAKGPELYCRARCFKRGRSLAFAEASVFSSPDYDEASLLATLSSTLAIRRLES
ncbi:MAG: PaaI family thioesterase [Bdellovibrionales bacterium]|nr:PaaI family thioesterase [Bdellovibrionales bacterium]